MLPTGRTDALSKNPLFIFNILVVPASTLEQRDRLPCPVQFTPAIAGRCTWPSGNILEYKIDRPLAASTEYSVKIELSQEFLYPLEKSYESKFSTTALAVLTGSLDESGTQRFSPKIGIPLQFTAPVALADLQKFVTLQSSTGAVIQTSFLSTENNSNQPSASYLVTGASGPLEYSTAYSLIVAK